MKFVLKNNLLKSYIVKLLSYIDPETFHFFPMVAPLFSDRAVQVLPCLMPSLLGISDPDWPSISLTDITAVTQGNAFKPQEHFPIRSNVFSLGADSSA